MLWRWMGRCWHIRGKVWQNMLFGLQAINPTVFVPCAICLSSLAALGTRDAKQTDQEKLIRKERVLNIRLCVHLVPREREIGRYKRAEYKRDRVSLTLLCVHLVPREMDTESYTQHSQLIADRDQLQPGHLLLMLWCNEIVVCSATDGSTPSTTLPKTK